MRGMKFNYYYYFWMLIVTHTKLVKIRMIHLLIKILKKCIALTLNKMFFFSREVKGKRVSDIFTCNMHTNITGHTSLKILQGRPN